MRQVVICVSILCLEGLQLLFTTITIIFVKFRKYSGVAWDDGRKNIITGLIGSLYTQTFHNIETVR